MSRLPVKCRRDVAAPGAADPSAADLAHGPFTSFRYSCSEISLTPGRARVRAKRAQLQDGKLTTESFEGDVDPLRGGEIVEAAQRRFAAQATLLLQPLEALLSFGRRRNRG